MIKKVIIGSCSTVGILSIAAVTTILVLNPMRKNFIASRNLKITASLEPKNISQSDLDEMISVTNSLEERAIALSKLFDGVTENNIKNIIVEETSNSSIILNAKEDYYFNQENVKSVTGNYNLLEVMNIKAKEGIINIDLDDINLIFSQVNSVADKVVVLSKLFDGITEENFANFQIEKTSNTIITLKANNGFAFNFVDLFSIEVNINIINLLNITPKDGPINVTDEDIVEIISVENTPEKLLILSKLFDGINESNIVHFIVEKVSNKIVTLKALNNYIFSFSMLNEITANINVVKILNIIPKKEIINVTNTDIIDMISTTNIPSKVIALSKLFDGIDELNVNNFIVEKNSETEITLKANDAFTFNNSTTVSIKANINIVTILNITSKKVISNVSEDDIKIMISTTNSLKERVAALSKLFDGINEENISNFTVERVTTTRVVLKANVGFVFGKSLLNSISADINKIVEILDIKAKNGTIDISQTDLDIMILTSNQIKDRVIALSKLFDGITEENIHTFKVTKNSNSVTLTTNEGFAFGSVSNTSVTSNFKIITILNITAKEGINNISQSDIIDMISSDINRRVTALSKVFNGINQNNSLNITVETSSNTLLILNANDGYAFVSTGIISIKANIKIVTFLNISPKSNIVDVLEEDIIEMTSTANSLKERVAALSKLFDGINEFNALSLKANKTSNTEITLNTIGDYVFDYNSSSSLVVNIRIITILNITAKPGIIDVTQEEINAMISTTNPLKERVAALSKLFNKITEENIINVKAIQMSDTEIILNTNGGFSFGIIGNNSIKAKIKIITILNITQILNVNEISQKDFNIIMSPTSPIRERAASLSKLFNGVTEQNVNNFTVSQADPDAIIVLTAKDGYAFGSINNFSVESFFKIILILNIVSKPGVNILSQADYNAIFNNYLEGRIKPLSKLFDGVNLSNIPYIFARKSSSTVITLEAKYGYSFGDISITSIQSSYKIVNVLNIKNKPIESSISLSESLIISPRSKSSSYKKIKVLKKLFDGVSKENFNHFTIDRIETSPIPKIVLTANIGYIFEQTNNNSIEIIFVIN
ncbi:MAG: hypothetical protein ACRCRP_00030 [Metamycoplasmataceae bacterium]